ncbi:MAG: SET domain-containing protein [Candidatus Lokiarchaeota archaeon]|nr:SET domain-containing protein [Candidatus Lokiarchaeota archaeon]
MSYSIPYNLTPNNPILKFAEVKSSPIHGLGLFAKIFIPKGTIWWHARPQDVLIISKRQFQTISASYKNEYLKSFFKALLTYSYFERDLNALIFCIDDSKYVNHSSDPNSGASEDENGFCSVALKDIQSGEEITEDYSKYTKSDWLQDYKEYFDPYYW